MILMYRRLQVSTRIFLFSMLFGVVFVFTALPAFAQEVTLEFDPSTFITQANLWIPTAMAIFAIGAGIAIAFALANLVASAIVNAIRSART